jgi:hypothetical protein
MSKTVQRKTATGARWNNRNERAPGATGVARNRITVNTTKIKGNRSIGREHQHSKSLISTLKRMDLEDHDMFFGLPQEDFHKAFLETQRVADEMKAMEALGLSYSEIRYCQLEEIDIADYLRRKTGAA